MLSPSETAAAVVDPPTGGPPASTPPAPDPNAEIRQWLADLTKKVTAKEDAEKAKADEAVVSGLKSQIAELMSAKDVEGLQAAVAKLEGTYSQKLTAAQKALEETQGRYHEMTKRSTLTDLTVGTEWSTPAAGRDALAKLDALLEVHVDSQGKRVVRGKDGRAAGDVIKAALGSEDFAHFLAPAARGRGGIGGGNRATPTALPEHGQPVDLVEAIALRIAAQEEEMKAAGLVKTVGFGRPAKRA